MTENTRSSRSLFRVPVSVLGLSVVLLLVCSEAGHGSERGRWSTCEVSLRLGVAGWERTTKAVLYAKRIDQAAAEQRAPRDLVSFPARTLQRVGVARADRRWIPATDASLMARRGQSDLPPPVLA